jgi:hypothetical protein
VLLELGSGCGTDAVYLILGFVILVRTECLPDGRKKGLEGLFLAVGAKGCGDILGGVLSCQAKLKVIWVGFELHELRSRS